LANHDTVEHSSAYVYAQFHQFENLTLTLGGSADSLEGGGMERDNFYPKFGVIWEPTAHTVIRAAAIKTLQRPLISRQNIQPSLEPTQVAGFNQFFFGVVGEEVWRYGIGIDQEFSDTLYAGAEYSERDRDTPILFLRDTPEFEQLARDEYFGRAYVYSTPLPTLALGAEYQYEDIDNHGMPFEEAVTEVKTHRLKLSANYFHPRGWIGGIDATYVDQDGEFQNINSGEITPGDDNFWILDASIGYRLPKRRGLISLEVNNVLDEEFRFQDTDPENPAILPERWVLLKITLAFDK
jgi:hypothetical protein